MPQVLQVLDIFEIWICQFLEFFWPPKVTMTRSKQRAEHDGDAIEGKSNISSGQ